MKENKYNALTELKLTIVQYIFFTVFIISCYFDLYTIGVISAIIFGAILILKKKKVSDAKVDITLICQECGKEFQPTKKESDNAILQGDKVYTNCPHCGKLAECKRKFS